MGTTFSISHRQAHGLRRTLIPILVALSLLASQLPFLGAGPAEAAIGPWSIDGTVPDSTPTMQTFQDPCNADSDDQPINGYKLNSIQNEPTPVFENKTLGAGKSDLCNVWLDLTTSDNDVLLYFAWQRYAAQGAVNVSLELQKGSLTPACSGTPDFFSAGGCNPFANRQAGDLLLTFDFDPVPAIYLRTWTGSDWSDATELNGAKALAAVDGGKNSTLRGESAINLTKAGILPGVGTDCVTFATVMPFSQTGNSNSAELKDIVLNGFPGPSISNCGRLVVQKETSPIELSGPFPVELKKGASSLASFNLAEHGSSFVYGDSADEPLFAGSDYTLTETVPSGWDPNYAVACTRGSANAIDGDGNITVAANSTTTCTITNTAIAPKITLVKTVDNQFGGTATAADFQAKLDGTNVAWDTEITTTIGSHTASEVMNVSGYTAGDWGGDCAANGSITLGPGDEATCSITNSDVQPTLTLEKTVDNTAGGTATEDDFQASIDGTDVDWDTAIGLNAGDYTASESTLPGYLAGPWGDDCAADGSVSLSVGDTKTCTITNTAIAPTLTVVKEVVNNSGGTLTPTDFPLYLNGDSVQHEAANSVTAGVEYTVTEDQQPGYAQTGIVCVDDDTEAELGHPLTLELAQSATCTITNDDVMPGLTVLKDVRNNDGGELGPDDFQLRVNGGPIAHGVALANPQAGVEYEVTEDDPTALGYEYVSTVCVDAGTQEEVANPVTLALGQAVVCTITNDDIAPTVTVTKQVINDDGGTAEVEDFTLYLGEDEVTSGETNTVVAGTEYTVSEDLVDGYEQVSLECRDAAGADLGATFTPGLADEIDCVIVNDDRTPTVTVTKIVNNNHGGTAEPGDFTLYLGADEVTSGVSNDVTAGTEYTVSEDLVAGYEQVAFSCVDGDENSLGDTFTPALDQHISCVIVNADIAPTVTVTKVVINDDGGTAEVEDFTLYLGEDEVTSGVTNDVTAGTEYTVSEDLVDGYEQVSLECTDGESALGATFTPALAQDIDCVITNDDIAPTLTVVKEVINDDGGTLGVGDFPLFLNGESVTSGVGNAVTAGVEYTATETQQTGYIQTDLVCVDDDTEAALGHPLTLELAQSATCTITNDDAQPGLTVVKAVTNDDGGLLGPDDFQLRVNGDAIAHNATIQNPQAGVAYDVTEDDPTALGYEYVSTVCVDVDTQEEVANPVTLALGQTVVCTITNDDIAPTVTVTKQVINDDGGTAEVEDFTLYLGEDEVTSGVTNDVTAGTEYTVSEDLVDGYEQVSLECTDGESALGATFTPELAQDINCVITNDDIAPTVTVTKQVINDDGGTAEVGDFTLYVGEDVVVSGVRNDVTAGTEYTVSEDLVDGYEQVSLECTDGESALGATFTPELAEDIDCVIVNDDIAPTVTVTKQVINDDGGTAEVEDFTLYLGEDEVVSGVSNDVTAGTEYTVSEDLVDGYEQVSLECTDGESALGATFTPELAQDIDCVITNDDIAPTVTVTKQVINDDGGTAVPADFTLYVGEDEVVSGVSNDVTAGTEYTVSEELVANYEQVSITCLDGEEDLGATFTLGLAQDVDCVIVNDDLPSGVSLLKEAVLDADEDGIKAITVDEGETATITYRFVVTNTGQTTLTDLVLVDDKIGPVTLTETTLAPGDSTEAFADYTLTAADIAAGQVDNIGTVTGTDGFGNDQTDQNDETVFVIEVLAGVPGLNLIKTALVDTDGQGNKVVEVDEGETTTVTYRYVITNTGNTVIDDLSLLDDKIGDITLPATSLEPGESITVDADYTLTAADIAAGSVENVAIVTGTDPTGTEVDATDDEVVDIVEVLVVVERPEVPVEVKPAVLQRTLPRTGVEGDRLLALGVLLASLGAATLLFTPRRRRSA